MRSISRAEGTLLTIYSPSSFTRAEGAICLFTSLFTSVSDHLSDSLLEGHAVGRDSNWRPDAAFRCIIIGSGSHLLASKNWRVPPRSLP